jgi:hypothetical protein
MGRSNIGRSFGALVAGVALATGIATPAAAATASVRYVTYDVPGYAGATFLNGVNNKGDLAGFVFDATGGSHGFIVRNGAVTVFDYPGTSGATIVQGMNNSDALSGFYTDASGVNHAFVRSPQGRFVAINAPGAGTASGQGTIAYGINDAGVVTGHIIDSAGVDHGFQDKHGTFTAFNDPSAGTSSGQGTRGANTTDSGVIVGYYTDSANVFYSFVDNNGTFSNFSVPGAGTGPGEGTIAFSISNNRSVIAGQIGPGPTPAATDSFLLIGGHFTQLDDPNAAPASTGEQAMDSQGDEVVGGYFDSSGVHGWIGYF